MRTILAIVTLSLVATFTYAQTPGTRTAFGLATVTVSNSAPTMRALGSGDNGKESFSSSISSTTAKMDFDFQSRVDYNEGWDVQSTAYGSVNTLAATNKSIFYSKKPINYRLAGAMPNSTMQLSVYNPFKHIDTVEFDVMLMSGEKTKRLETDASGKVDFSVIGMVAVNKNNSIKAGFHTISYVVNIDF